MTDHTGPWPAGTPCWVDIMVADLSRSEEFYSRLLGWDFLASGEEFGGYTNALLGGRRVAGMSPTMPGMEDAPHVWSVYLATEDIDALDAAATAAGARPLVKPMTVGQFGRMGLWIDPTGAAFGAWQGDEHQGFEAGDEPGAPGWCDLMTSDVTAAKNFYGSLFSLEFIDAGMEGMEYAMFSVPGGERPAGGIGQQNEGQPSGWSVCFEHADVDAAAQEVPDLDGRVLGEPFDFEFGRLVIVAGPDGEVFSLITPKQSDA